VIAYFDLISQQIPIENSFHFYGKNFPRKSNKSANVTSFPHKIQAHGKFHTIPTKKIHIPFNLILEKLELQIIKKIEKRNFILVNIKM
jgi:hypothetical protein